MGRDRHGLGQVPHFRPPKRSAKCLRTRAGMRRSYEAPGGQAVCRTAMPNRTFPWFPSGFESGLPLTQLNATSQHVADGAVSYAV